LITALFFIPPSVGRGQSSGPRDVVDARTEFKLVQIRPRPAGPRRRFDDDRQAEGTWHLVVPDGGRFEWKARRRTATHSAGHRACVYVNGKMSAFVRAGLRAGLLAWAVSDSLDEAEAGADELF